MSSSDRVRQVSLLPEPKGPPVELVAARGRPRMMPLPGGDLGASRDTGDEPPPSRILVKAEGACPISIDPDRAAAGSIGDFYESVIFACADRAAMLARHRDERPLRGRARAEERLFAQIEAIVASGPGMVRDLEAYWRARRDDEEGYRIWPVVFTLASLEGPMPLCAVEKVVEGLPPEAIDKALCAADALIVAPNPHWMALGLDLASSPYPLARVVGIELLSRRRAFSPDQAVERLLGPSPAVIAAALRALARHPEGQTASARVEACLASVDPSIAGEAARALTLWGSREPYLALKQGGPLGRVIEPVDQIEIVVMAGSIDDVALVQSILGRTKISPAVLRAVGRLGSAGTWSFLLHYLADGVLAQAAKEAIASVFGDLVAGKEAKSPAAWREAISRQDLDPAVRLRRGKPWSAATVVSECRSGDLGRMEIDRRLDEIRARTGRFSAIDTGALAIDLSPALDDLGRAHGGTG
jgi:hypothetical protein